MRARVATAADGMAGLGVSVHNLHSAGFNLLQRAAAQEENTEPTLWVLNSGTGDAVVYAGRKEARLPMD